MSARHIDAAISAELPNPDQNPELFHLVTSHMLHPQCDVDITCGCRHDANGDLCECQRHYPKDMCTETIIVPDGYPKYRRRGRFTATLPDGRIITDNWVVPHNAYLLLRYQAHCNVECCVHFRCFKYVYKYTFKPPDHTAVVVNEIDAHLAGRLLSASEAVHRLLALPLHKEWPSVIRLDIHMPHMQNMVFDPTSDEQDLLQQMSSTTSMLMGWFELNREDPIARTLYYHDIPAHYVWADCRWKRRIRTKVRIFPACRCCSCD